MNNTAKLLLGLVLGYVGYLAYQKLQATKTVTTTTDVTLPPSNSILPGDVSQTTGQYMTPMMAGWR
jgi:hypothetical protein